MGLREVAFSPESLSVVVPVYQEAPNLEPLVRGIVDAVAPLGLATEIIVVDDGSTDRTAEILRELADSVLSLRAVRLRRNFGQTQALQAGLDFATGDVIVTMDGDLQNDPADIPRLLERLSRGADVVSGWREERRDDLVLRKIPSWVANALLRAITGVPIHDQGCSLKAYRASVVRELDLYADMHRFIAILTLPLGARIDEIPVRHNPRVAGESKYGVSRVLKVLADLAGIQMLARFRQSPIRWFALLASPFLLGALGAFTVGRIVAPGSVVLVTVSVMMGLTFVSTVLLGVVGEAVVELDGDRRRPLQHEWEPLE